MARLRTDGKYFGELDHRFLSAEGSKSVFPRNRNFEGGLGGNRGMLVPTGVGIHFLFGSSFH